MKPKTFIKNSIYSFPTLYLGNPKFKILNDALLTLGTGTEWKNGSLENQYLTVTDEQAATWNCFRNYNESVEQESETPLYGVLSKITSSHSLSSLLLELTLIHQVHDIWVRPIGYKIDSETMIDLWEDSNVEEIYSLSKECNLFNIPYDVTEEWLNLCEEFIKYIKPLLSKKSDLSILRQIEHRIEKIKLHKNLEQKNE